MTQDDSATAAQRTYLSFLAAGRTPEMTEAARRLDKQSHATLKALRSKLLNNECFDCTQSMPGWAALPHGVFVCIDCAQVHRHLGRHISQVKAVNTGTYLWFAPEVALMEKVGNAKAARAFAACNLPPKPSRDSTAEQRLAYCKLKYSGAQQPAWVEADASSSTGSAIAWKEDTAKAEVAVPPKVVAKTSHIAKTVASKKAGLPGASRTVLTPPHTAVETPNLIDFDAVALEPPPPTVTPAAPAADAAFFAQFGIF